jgi:hypothetical protein
MMAPVVIRRSRFVFPPGLSTTMIEPDAWPGDLVRHFPPFAHVVGTTRNPNSFWAEHRDDVAAGACGDTILPSIA